MNTYGILQGQWPADPWRVRRVRGKTKASRFERYIDQLENIIETLVIAGAFRCKGAMTWSCDPVLGDIRYMA